MLEVVQLDIVSIFASIVRTTREILYTSYQTITYFYENH